MKTLEIATVEDLVRVLDEHPQWLEALRGRLLTRELLEQPQHIAAFIAATDQRFTELASQLADFVAASGRRFTELELRLAAFVAATDQRFTALERQLAASQAATDQRFAELERQLAASQAATDQRFAALERQLAASQAATDQRFTELAGQLADFAAATDRRFEALERQFGQLRNDVGPVKAFHAAMSARAEADLMAEERGLKYVAVVDRDELADMARSAKTGDISKEDLRSFRFADIVIRAAKQDGTACYLAVEVSYTVDKRDSERAQRNARFLTRFTGQRADPVVAGLRYDDRILEEMKSGRIAWYQLHPQAFEVE